jgi:tryptophan-rich sensory protein
MDVFSIIVLMGFIGACLLAAMIAARYRPGHWYEKLAKPRWRPPNWLFPPAWAVLYLTIAVSGWLVWRTSGFAGAPKTRPVYLEVLAHNGAW